MQAGCDFKVVTLEVYDVVGKQSLEYILTYTLDWDESQTPVDIDSLRVCPFLDFPQLP